MVGGAGERRTLRLVTRHTDWWNDPMRPLAETRRKLDVLRRHRDQPFSQAVEDRSR
jgi:hypothetical protein